MIRFPINIAGIETNFTLKLGFSINAFKSSWECLPNKSSLISFSFLKTLEECPPKDLKPFYGCLYDSQQDCVGLFVFQIKNFKAKESMRFGGEQDLFCKIHAKLRSIIVNLVEFETLICGNLLLTGPYGFVLKPKFKESEGLVYQHVIEEVQGWLKVNNYDINVTLVKDFYPAQPILHESTYHTFSIQPNMVLNYESAWNSFEDYLSDLHSKYRIRAKRAIKSASPVQKKQMSLDDVFTQKEVLYSLYKQTATNAEFNLLDLHSDYFYGLKKNLADQIHFYSYSINEQVVAFFTIIEDDHEHEAHFLGIDETLNKKHQLYLNILFDIIRIGIQRKKKVTRFSRTAVEIKSSVGAIPYTMHCYIKHRKVINNTFVPYLLDFLNQKQKYVLRHPFKSMDTEGQELTEKVEVY